MKSWKQVSVTTLKPGDVVADYGMVHSVVHEEHRVKIVAGERDYFVSFVNEADVFAFTEDAP